MHTSLLWLSLLNLLIELCVAYVAGLKTPRALLAIFLVNLATNPLINYLIWIGVIDSWAGVLTAEAVVVIAEAILLSVTLRKSLKQCLGISLLMNGASFTIGCIVYLL